MVNVFELRDVDRQNRGPAVLDVDRMLREERRHVLGRKPGRDRHEPLVGLALSGGGVRSATTSLGFLKELLEAGVLQNVDYLSSVSGGSYASGYLYSAFRAFRGRNDQMFARRAQEELVAAGRYLARGRGLSSAFRLARLLASVISMSLLNLLWLFLLGIATAMGVDSVLQSLGICHTVWLARILLGALLVPLIRLIVLTAVRAVSLLSLHTSSAIAAAGQSLFTAAGKLLNVLEGAALTAALAAALVLGLCPALCDQFDALCRRVFYLQQLFGVELVDPRVAQEALQRERGLTGLIAVVLAALVGVLASSDVIGVNAVFRNLVDSAYLKAGWRAARRLGRDLFLRDLDRETALPYPLYNGGLYLCGESELEARREQGNPGQAHGSRLVGMQAMDYFLFSPLFCGSAATHYADTRTAPYTDTTLANAVAISAASISPLADGHANVAVSFLMSLFNLNLGVWLANPKRLSRWPTHRLYFWPLTYIRLFTRRLTTERTLVHVADGGFVENLGVMELLRRRCQVIIAIDNTYDPHYDFHWLRNLMARATTEEELQITFRDDVEQELRPSLVSGFSRSAVAVARVESRAVGESFEGYLVYVKACVTQQMANDANVDDYQTYHPAFPQETTANQFFDPPQWNAYYELGRTLAGSVLARLGAARTRAAVFAAVKQGREQAEERK